MTEPRPPANDGAKPSGPPPAETAHEPFQRFARLAKRISDVPKPGRRAPS